MRRERIGIPGEGVRPADTLQQETDTISTTTAVTDIEQTRNLHRVAKRLEAEARDYRAANLEERAASVEKELEQVRETIQAQDEARREAKSRSRERDAEQKKKHEAETKARREAAERRRAAREWFEVRQLRIPTQVAPPFRRMWPPCSDGSGPPVAMEVAP